MGDADDEHYVTFGTPLDPLDEDNMPRKKPITIEEQYACDEQGRRRFHGAFTGGFSAGYFNTVGTRDGWRPQNFKSSRSSKAENKSQKPQDFMDDEDMGEFGIAPTAIRATSDYTNHNNQGTKRQRNRCNPDGSIPGVPVLEEILAPVKDTVGVKLLKQMGWKPGQGAGPRLTKKEKSQIRQQNEKLKVYGCASEPMQQETVDSDSDISEDDTSNITFAPDDYELFRCTPKDNFFGIGYSGLDKRSILSQHVNLFDPAPFKLQEKNKKLSIRGQAFGVGAFEAEDEDIYSREDMSQYDFTLAPKEKSKSRWSTDEKSSTSKKNCIDGFVPAKEALASVKTFKLPELPKDFNPVHVVRKSRFEPMIETSLENARRKGLARHDLSAQDRARIINDPKPITLVLSNDKNKNEIESKKPHANTIELRGDAHSPMSVQNVSPSKCTVISNIISRTLNLKSKEKIVEKQGPMSEQGFEAPTNIEINKNVESNKNSWLEKCKMKSFVSGGLENLSESLDKPSESVEVGTSSTDVTLNNSLTKESSLNPDQTIDYMSQHETENESSVFKPFVTNPDKQKRYEKFLELSKSDEKEKLLSIQPLSMTEWERDQERVEFEQAARLYKPLTGSMSDRFTSSKQRDDLNPFSVVDKTENADSQLKAAAKKKIFGKLTRQRIKWQPAAIVCKRFNIAEPKSGCVQSDNEKKTKYSVFDYLEESVHNNSTFQSVADFTDKIKTNIESSKNSASKEAYISLDVRNARESAMLVHDNLSIDKLSTKERNFEAKYVKIFGKNVNLAVPHGNGVTIEDEKYPAESIDTVVVATDSTSQVKDDDATSQPDTVSLGLQNAAKKDLFKSIFLSSSEDSDSENEVVDDEKLKSVLIGRNPTKMNVQRNNSPPRGIFANLDLDSLNARNVRNEKINFVDTGNVSKNDGGTSTTGLKENKDDVVNETQDEEQPSNNSQVECESNLKLPPDMYGPLPPVRPATYGNSSTTETSSELQKPVFKSIVVPVSSSISAVKGEWIEKRKDSKSKKEKKKHKHKDRKKHKHKKHKR